MKKIKLFLAAVAILCSAGSWAQASYNHSYTEGVEVTAGSDYFLYNIGSGMFLTDGMDWGTHATADHAGRLITFAALDGGKYSIYTSSASVNNGAEAKAGFMTTNGYLDTGSNDANWEFTSISVDGYTNAYTIKNSDTQYLYYNVEDARVNVGESTGNNYSYWIIVPKSAREAAKDYTFYLQNTDFNRPWERVIWKISGGFTNQAGGLAGNRCAEVYGHSFDLNQTISTPVANGKYILYNQAFYNNNDASNQTYLYANKDQVPVGILNAHDEGTESYMNGASTSFSAGYYVNSVPTIVTDNTLKVGLKNSSASGSAWSIFDNFYLEYLGTCLVNDAIELPASGDMAADTWYYFVIGAAADDYKVTATTLGDIICTNDGTQLTGSATGNVTLKATDNSFEAIRYYVKSSSANNLEVAAGSYVYNVGSATSDFAYIQPGNVVTVAYAELSTNNPKATLTKDFSGVTFGGNAISVTPTENGFTFTVPEVTVATAYTLAIPSNSIGYSAGSTFNESQNITLTAAAVFDGVYYMYHSDTETYLSRGGNYNTQAIMDTYGLAFKITTDATNNTTLQYFDSFLWLGDDGNCYGDCGTDRQRRFNVTKVEGGYKFFNTNNSKYLAVSGGVSVANADEGSIWTIESTSSHVANYAKNANAQAAAAALAAGIDGITTKADLDAELASNYGEASIAITGAKAEKYQVYPGSGKDSGPVTYYSETVNDLKPGLYKLSVDAFQRAADNDKVFAADGARGVIYLYAGDAKTQLKSVSEYGNSTKYADTDYQYEGLYYPNREGTAYDALATGNYRNEVYVYVADAGEGTGSLEIGIKNPSRLGGNFATWSVYNNWTLTYYEEGKATAAQKKALADAIEAVEDYVIGFDAGEYAPYNNAEAIAARTAAMAINPETALGDAVDAATTALTGATWTANATEVNAVYDGTFAAAENNGAPKGWRMSNNTLGGDYHSRAFVGDDRLEEFNGTYSALFLRFDGTNSSRGSMYYYGDTEGYTMPLKAGVTYYAKVDVAGWNSTGKPIRMNVTGPEGFVALSDQITTTFKADQTTGTVPQQLLVVFQATVSGNYVINFQTPGADTNTHNVVISNVEVKRATAAMMKITDAKYATFVAPFDVTIPDDVEVYTVDGVSGSALTLSQVITTIPAKTPVVLFKDKELDETTFYGYPVGDPENGLLVGTYTETTAPNNGSSFVLQDGAKGIGFYKVVTDDIKVPANRAYLNYSGGDDVKAFFFGGGEDAIKSVFDGVAAGEIYDLSGRKVAKMQKGGAYIVNGKKVIVK